MCSACFVACLPCCCVGGHKLLFDLASSLSPEASGCAGSRAFFRSSFVPALAEALKVNRGLTTLHLSAGRLSALVWAGSLSSTQLWCRMFACGAGGSAEA
eukprot:5241197-Pleurochrysis_carterae.AAC.2